MKLLENSSGIHGPQAKELDACKLCSPGERDEERHPTAMKSGALLARCRAGFLLPVASACCFVSLMFGLTRTASADSFQWIDGSGSWTDSQHLLLNWQDLSNPDLSNPPDYFPQHLPGTSDSVNIGNGGAPQVAGNAGAGSLYIYSGSSLGLVSSGSLGVSGGEYVAYSGGGTVSQSGGTHQVGADLLIGYNTGSVGTYNLSGFGSLAVNSTESIGFLGAGTFTQNGGTNVAPRLFAGYGYGSSGTYNLISGTLTIRLPNTSGLFDEIVGWSGNGHFVQTGGMNNTRRLALGVAAGITAIYDLNGGALNVDFDEYVGLSGGISTFNQRSGTNTITGIGTTFQVGNVVGGVLRIGQNTGSDGTCNLSGTGVLSVTAFESIGFNGTGTFNQSNGTTHTISDSLFVGDGATGAYNLFSGNLTVNSFENVGNNGNGTFTQTGGTHTLTGTGGNLVQVGNVVGSVLYIGINAGFHGGYNLSGTGMLSITGFESIGFLGTGSFNQTGGTNSVSTGLYVGDAGTGVGTFSLSGNSTLSVGSYETVGYNGNGTFTQNGGNNTRVLCS